MIDTIVLRLHNLKKYATTVNVLFKHKKGSATRLYIDKETGEYLENHKDLEVFKVFYHNSNQLEFVNHNSAIALPSSHYSVAYCIHFKSDFIEFNFSIPKYRYGSNLFQFIDYFSQMAEKQYGITMEFIQRFKGNFLDKISDYDLEINRIDFCYNQFFISREEALRYKEVQEKAFERKSRSSKGYKKYGAETLMLVTDRYSFKVYHKGEEFAKNDYKILAAKNYKAYDLDKMRKIADRTLRYECTFRSKYLFYQWRQLHIDGRRRIKGSVYNYLFKVCLIQCGNDAMRGSNNLNVFNSAVSSTSVPSLRFCIKSNYDNWRDVKARYGIYWIKQYQNDDRVTFDFNLFNALYVEFWKHVKSVQISSSSNLSAPLIRQRIGRFSKEENTKKALDRKPGVEKNVGRLMAYFEISQRGSLKAHYKRGYITRATYQRIMKVFKRIGLADYNPVVNLAKPGLGYQDYKNYFGSFVN